MLILVFGRIQRTFVRDLGNISALVSSSSNPWARLMLSAALSRFKAGSTTPPSRFTQYTANRLPRGKYHKNASKTKRRRPYRADRSDRSDLLVAKLVARHHPNKKRRIGCGYVCQPGVAFSGRLGRSLCKCTESIGGPRSYTRGALLPRYGWQSEREYHCKYDIQRAIHPTSFIGHPILAEAAKSRPNQSRAQTGVEHEQKTSTAIYRIKNQTGQPYFEKPQIFQRLTVVFPQKSGHGVIRTMIKRNKPRLSKVIGGIKRRR
jgi:hypothetical protein